jgi:hypothetical protein
MWSIGRQDQASRLLLCSGGRDGEGMNIFDLIIAIFVWVGTWVIIFKTDRDKKEILEAIEQLKENK